MPTYEYRCRRCATEFEQFQRITAKPEAPCPRCGAKAERLLSAGAGLVFKGSGFYLTDYGRSGQQRRPEPEKPASEKPAVDKPAKADKPKKKAD
jgi:putative FmdB family regulatory protein